MLEEKNGLRQDHRVAVGPCFGIERAELAVPEERLTRLRLARKGIEDETYPDTQRIRETRQQTIGGAVRAACRL